LLLCDCVHTHFSLRACLFDVQRTLSAHDCLLTTQVLGVIFIDACNQFLIFPFIPFLVRDQLALAADDPNVPLFSGLLAAAYLFGQFACSPFYGALSERLGRRPVLLVCVVISTIFLIAFGFSDSYMLSVGLRLMQGGFAGALTVGKLYLADVSDQTNEGKVFSYIGIAIGSGCITGPAIGGYLADPALLLPLLPAETFLGGIVRAYPYLAPCAAGAVVSIVLFFVALFTLPESRPPTIPLFGGPRRERKLSHVASPAQRKGLDAPLLANAQQGASATISIPGVVVGGGSANGSLSSSPAPPNVIGVLSRGSSYGGGSSNGGLARRESSNALLEAMASHASRGSLLVYEEEEGAVGGDVENGNGNGVANGGYANGRRSPYARAPSPVGSGSHESSPKPVSAVGLALKYSLSPKAQRAPLFSSSGSLQGLASGQSSPEMPGATITRVPGSAAGRQPLAAFDDAEGSEDRQRAVFWLIQAACLLFALTNVGLTEVLPVWLSTPPDASGEHPGSGGLGLSPSLIGNLQSTTGVGNIVLALFVTFRIIRTIGPVNTFAISLFVNAVAAFGPPLIQAIPGGCPESLALGVMCVAYSLVAASRNMMFATAIMLSKESAAGAPGVAIGINQSACSLGSALGPMLTGLAYTQSLAFLRTCVPFFVGVGVLGALPGFMMKLRAPPWPWRSQPLQPMAPTKA
jgi:MFS family permease